MVTVIMTICHVKLWFKFCVSWRSLGLSFLKIPQVHVTRIKAFPIQFYFVCLCYYYKYLYEGYMTTLNCFFFSYNVFCVYCTSLWTKLVCYSCHALPCDHGGFLCSLCFYDVICANCSFV